MSTVTEIEITPEMIEAGARVVAGGHLDCLDPKDLAEVVYSAMRPLEPEREISADAKKEHPG